MELDFGGGGGVGLLGRPIIRWTRSPLAYDRVSVLRLLFPSLTFPFLVLMSLRNPHLYDLRSLLRRAVT